VVTVRAAMAEDREAVAAFLEARGMRPIARLGELVDPVEDPILVAEDPYQALTGVLTYRIAGPDCEVTTLFATVTRQGTGTALLDAVEVVARAAGCRRLWLITTNDNLDALRFYQRRGLRLAGLHPGAVDDSRATLKPSISEVGEYDIPIRDELVLELAL
jgi:ribosomal protein S18 acetylase RimI-like enzyme